MPNPKRKPLFTLTAEELAALSGEPAPAVQEPAEIPPEAAEAGAPVAERAGTRPSVSPQAPEPEIAPSSETPSTPGAETGVFSPPVTETPSPGTTGGGAGVLGDVGPNTPVRDAVGRETAVREGAGAETAPRKGRGASAPALRPVPSDPEARRAGWHPIDNGVVDRVLPDLMRRLGGRDGPGVFLVYFFLYRETVGWRREEVTVSNNSIMRLLGVDLKTARRWMNLALASGWVERVRAARGQEGGSYRVRRPTGQGRAEFATPGAGDPGSGRPRDLTTPGAGGLQTPGANPTQINTREKTNARAREAVSNAAARRAFKQAEETRIAAEREQAQAARLDALYASLEASARADVDRRAAELRRGPFAPPEEVARRLALEEFERAGLSGRGREGR